MMSVTKLFRKDTRGCRIAMKHEVALLVVLTALIGIRPASGAIYMVTDLGNFDSSPSQSGGNSTSFNGQSVGWFYVDPAQTVKHACLYSNGVRTDLNTLIDPRSGWLLTAAWGMVGSYIGGDGILQGSDHAFALIPTLPGDANVDGTVDVADLNIVLTNFDQSASSFRQGDANNDGVVDISDLNTVLTNFDHSVGVDAAAIQELQNTALAGAPVPEASSAVVMGLLWICAGLVTIGRRWFV
jgi:hypothetical protein